jgi:hypothetical protein
MRAIIGLIVLAVALAGCQAPPSAPVIDDEPGVRVVGTATPVAWADVGASEDTYVARYDPTADNSRADVLAVAYSGATSNESALLWFDLSPWQPAPTDVQTALLRLYVTDGPGTVTVYRLLRLDWGELANWTQTGVSGRVWAAPGLLAGSDYTAVGSVSVVVGSSAGWITIDVTELVQDALVVNRGYWGAHLR